MQQPKIDDALVQEILNYLAQVEGAQVVQNRGLGANVESALKLLLGKPLPKPEAVQELQCLNRILHLGKNYCVDKPPRMKELPTLEICKVCKQRKLGLTEKTLSPSLSHTEPQTLQTKPQPPRFGTDPKIDATPYCNHVGMKVYYRKCEKCDRPCDRAPDTNPNIPLVDRDRRRLAKEAIPLNAPKGENQHDRNPNTSSV